MLVMNDLRKRNKTVTDSVSEIVPLELHYGMLFRGVSLLQLANVLMKGIDHPWRKFAHYANLDKATEYNGNSRLGSLILAYDRADFLPFAIADPKSESEKARYVFEIKTDNGPMFSVEHTEHWAYDSVYGKIPANLDTICPKFMIASVSTDEQVDWFQKTLNGELSRFLIWD